MPPAFVAFFWRREVGFMSHSGQKRLGYYGRFPLSPLGPGDGLDFGAALAGALGDFIVLILDGDAGQILE